MIRLGLLNPKAGAGQSRLILGLGWVLASAGFRVGLVDFDPQTGLTELALGPIEASGSVYAALASLSEGGKLETPEPVELAPNLWLVRGHVSTSIFDDVLATAWVPSADPRLVALVQGIEAMIDHLAEDRELDVVLCALGSSLGPLCHAVAAAVDTIVVPLGAWEGEPAAMRSLASALRRWRTAPSLTEHAKGFPVLGCVMIRPAGVVEVDIDRLVAACRGELGSEYLGIIKEFPSLAAMAHGIHKPEIELTMADGAVGSLAAAVVDLRRQYEALATRLVHASGILDEDLLLDALGQALFGELLDDLPGALDELSLHTTVESVSGVELETVAVCSAGLRVTGSASVTVTLDLTLERGGGERRDGMEARDHFALRFDLELDRSHESVTVVHRLEIDTSSSSA